MSTEQGQDRAPAPGSVPNAYGNALAWRWTRQMPAAVRRSGLPTLLYALRALANAAGELRFTGDRKPIRIKDIAAAAVADEKDARRYLKAAQAAGVVGVKGEQRRGKSTLYVLVLNPNPDWEAAAASLEETKRKRAERKAAPWQEEENGGRSPELPEAENGGPPPVLDTSEAKEERGTAPRMGSGDRPPFGSGDRPPNNPGRAKELPHEVAGAVVQPHVVPGAQDEKRDHSQGHDDHEPAPPDDDSAPPPPPLGFARCTACGDRMVPRPGRTTHTHCQPAQHREAS